MNGLLSMIGMQTELEYQMGDDFPFGSPRIRFNVPKGNILSDKPEALRRMKEGKKVRRVIWKECGAYIHIVSETIVAVCDGKFFPCVFKDSEDILATDWEEVER